MILTKESTDVDNSCIVISRNFPLHQAKIPPPFASGKKAVFSNCWEQTIQFVKFEWEEETDDLDKFGSIAGMDHGGNGVDRLTNKQQRCTQHIRSVSLGTQIIILKCDETKTVSDHRHESEPV